MTRVPLGNPNYPRNWIRKGVFNISTQNIQEKTEAFKQKGGCLRYFDLHLKPQPQSTFEGSTCFLTDLTRTAERGVQDEDPPKVVREVNAISFQIIVELELFPANLSVVRTSFNKLRLSFKRDIIFTLKHFSITSKKFN